VIPWVQLKQSVCSELKKLLLKIEFCVIIISIQPLGRFWQEPGPSQATGMALAHCILGKFLGVVCLCFPLPSDVLTLASRCLHVLINASAASSERWNCGREWSADFAEMTPFLHPLGIFYMSQICDMGQTALLPLQAALLSFCVILLVKFGFGLCRPTHEKLPTCDVFRCTVYNTTY
jgi:hypothetical protein